MTTPSSEGADWHWLALDGNEVAGDEWELVSGLSTGALESATLVWKRGWAEWMPANRVSELSSALPSAKRQQTRDPRLDPLIVRPPARPGGLRAEAPPPPRRSQASAPKLDAKPPIARAASNPSASSGTAPRASDTIPPSSFGVIGGTKPTTPKPAAVRPALQRARMPLPTLSDEPLHQSATATLRPPNAVPPPPRAMPTLGIEAPADPVERIEVTATPLPSVIVATGMEGEVEHFPSNPPPEPKAPSPGFVKPDPERGLDSTLDTAKSPSKSARQLALIQASRTTSPDIVHAENAQRRSVRNAMRNSMASIVERARPPVISVTGRALLALLMLSGVSGALAVSVVVLFMTRDGNESDRLGTEVGSATSQPSLPAPNGCALAQPAARLAAEIERSVPISVDTLPNGKLAVGFGSSKTKAAGLSIDPDAFEAAQVFEADDAAVLRAVVPTVKGGAASFIVDRETAGLEASRSVDAAPRFTLGQSPAGFARRTESGAISVVWPGGGNEKITDPRLAEASDSGYAVTFRRGGQFGSVFLGWLGKDGSAKTPLFKVESGVKYSGTPSLAVNDRGALLAFAGRDAPTAAWRLLLATATPLEAPGKVSEFRPLDVASGGAISPVMAGLSGGRWFLQWTEGTAGSYRVRAQTLSHDLVPIDRALLVSPKGANAGQGVAWVNRQHAISLFILTTADRDELWGATLTCQ